MKHISFLFAISSLTLLRIREQPLQKRWGGRFEVQTFLEVSDVLDYPMMSQTISSPSPCYLLLKAPLEEEQ